MLVYKVVYISFLLISTHGISGHINFSSIPCINRNPRIVGGIETEKHELPFIVSLKIRGGHFCGATIIHERWILTAGHCTCNGLNKFMKATQIQGVIGLHRMSKHMNIVLSSQEKPSAVQINFKNVVPHPKYKCEMVHNDIALLELERSVRLPINIQPTCLPLDSSEQIDEDTVATVFGWGWTDENHETGQRSDILRKANVKVWSNKQCEKSYQLNGNPKMIVTDTQVCAGINTGGVDSCWTDSGGPLISKEYVLIGIVSTGVGCGRPGLPGIYTRVSKYITWIESTILYDKNYLNG